MRLKKTPLLFNIVIIAYLITNCGNSPMDVVNKGQLQMRISFAEEINKTSTLRERAIVDQIGVTISDLNGEVIASSNLTQNGSTWQGSMELDPADNLTVTVEALENSVLRYAGFSSGVDVQAGKTAPVEITLSSHAIFNIKLTPPSPASLLFNQDVTITVDYVTNEAEGVRIYGGGFRNGSESPYLDIPMSRLFFGNGSAPASFTISPGGPGSVNVDEIKFKMFNADQSRPLYENSVPVAYHFSDSRI